MNNNKFQRLSGLEQELFLDKVTELKIAENWEGCLTLLEGMLASDTTLTRANRVLWFIRAICLDMLLRPSEALTIFKALVEAFPLQHEFTNSLEHSLVSTARYAIKKFDNDRSQPLIEHYYNATRSVDYSPWPLSEIYIDYLICTGQGEKAKQISLSYIELSPNDYDYLKKAINVAQQINDEVMLKFALAQVDAAFRLNPADDHLASLLTLSVPETERQAA